MARRTLRIPRTRARPRPSRRNRLPGTGASCASPSSQAAACVVLLGAVAVGAYLLVNHLAGGIHRTPVTLPKVPGGQSTGAMNVLITSSGVTAYHVVSAMTSMLTVDSNFTNSEVETLATRLNRVSGSGGTFVTAPTSTTSGHRYLNSSLSNELWAAIRTDSIAAFAAKYPATITPSVSG